MSAKPTRDAARREAQNIVQGIAGEPKSWRENVTTGIARASRLSGYSFGTVKKLWYAERAVIPSEIMDDLRQINAEQAEKTRREIEAANALYEAREKTHAKQSKRGGKAGCDVAPKQGRRAFSAGGRMALETGKGA